MFRCQVTGKLSKPNEKSVKLVSKTRPRSYPYLTGREGDENRKEMVAQGSEIVEELTVTKETAALVAAGKLELKKR